jgi:PAS domain S-box-containing protein
MEEGLCLLGEHGRVLYANPQAYQLLHYPPDQLIGQPLSQLLPPEQSQQSETGHLRRQDGSLFMATYTFTPLIPHEESEQPAGAILLFRDVTAQKQLEQKLRRQVRETTLFNRVINTTTSASDVVTILRLLSTELAHALHVPQVACALLNEGQTHLTVVAEYRTAERTSALGTVIPVENNPGTQQILRTHRPLIATDVQQDERVATRALARERGTVSMMILPLLARDKIIGTMGINSPTRREFTPEEISLAQNVATAASQALDNAALYERVQAELRQRQQQNEYLAALYETTLGLLERLDTTSLLEAIVIRAGALTGTEHGALYVVDDREIRLKAGTGIYRGHIGTQLRWGGGLSGKVWQTGELIAVDDYEAAFPTPSRFGRLYAAVGVPLRSGTMVTGVLGLARLIPGRPFTAEELDLLQRFAQLAALVLQNALLYTAVQNELIEREATQKKLQEAKLAAEEANRVKSSFLASMSHELRTPLNAIIGYSDLLAEEIEDMGEESLLVDVRRIQKAGVQLLGIISDILDISKIEAGQAKVVAETFSVADMLDMLESIYLGHFAERGNELLVDFPPDIGEAHTDYHKVQQILTNLLGNANKFTQGGEVRLTAVRHTIEQQPHITFTVADTGIGIPTDKLETIFDPFRQADESMSRQYGGTGLGLAICRRFTESLGGTINVQSAPNQGSVFTVCLPAVLPQNG